MDRPTFIGIHDPESRFSDVEDINMMSTYYAWNKDNNDVHDALLNANQMKASFLITIEPWPIPIGLKYKSTNELLTVYGGEEYKQTALDICHVLSTSEVPVYIRWGHEMEMKNSRYPWSFGDPNLYISAYRNFVETCRTKSALFKFVWSPGGELGLESYWPGDKYVDLIGVSVYSFDQYDEKKLGKRRSFKEVFQPIYNRVNKYNKPILIAEMGVTGTDEYKVSWLNHMITDARTYNKLVGFVYLNTLDPQATWGKDFDNPDWRLPETAKGFFSDYHW